MFFALNDNKIKVSAWDSEKRDGKGNLINYYCPECGEQLTLRKGEIYSHHFSHKGDSTCRLSTSSGGESDIHAFMKYKMCKIIEEDNNVIESDYEYRIGDMIADYYCTLKDNNGKVKRVAVEVVHKHTDIKDFIDKNEYYYKQGVYCLWIFNLDRFINRYDDIFEIDVGFKFKSSVTINEIIKNAHVLNFGKIYALDRFNDTIYAIHLESLFSYDSNKKIVPHKIDEFKLSYFNQIKSDDFLEYNRTIASPYVKQFWTKKKWDYKFKKNNKNKKDNNNHENNGYTSNYLIDKLQNDSMINKLRQYYLMNHFNNLKDDENSLYIDYNYIYYKNVLSCFLSAVYNPINYELIICFSNCDFSTYFSCDADENSLKDLFDEYQLFFDNRYNVIKSIFMKIQDWIPDDYFEDEDVQNDLAMKFKDYDFKYGGRGLFYQNVEVVYNPIKDEVIFNNNDKYYCCDCNDESIEDLIYEYIVIDDDSDVEFLVNEIKNMKQWCIVKIEEYYDYLNTLSIHKERNDSYDRRIIPYKNNFLLINLNQENTEVIGEFNSWDDADNVINPILYLK